MLDNIECPKTADEYWLLAEHHRENLQNLVVAYHPYYRRNHSDKSITATGAEIVCVKLRTQIAKRTQDDPQQLFKRYLQFKDARIADLLDEVWIGIPESIEVRGEPGFAVLCNLCSESYVLNCDMEEYDVD